MKFILPAALTLGLLAGPAFGGMKDAVAAYDRGDYALAMREFLPMALAGVPQARFDLGLMHATGRGVPRDISYAAMWYRLAADQGFAPAQYEYGTLLAPAEAAAWFQRAADQGYAPAAFWLGLAYREGWGVPRSDVDAVRSYRRAAEAGLAEAQSNLGLMYERGDGIPQDEAEALRWYRRAAELGQPEAQFNLAAMLEEGRGAAPDAAAAAAWYRRAADRGVVAAMNNLGVVLEKGDGISGDPALAYAWYEAASVRGGSGSAADQAGRNRDQIAARLSSDELVRARREAQQILARVTAATSAAPSEVPGVSAASPADKSLTLRIQESLRTLGYDPGPPQTRMGSKIASAIREFQADVGAPVTGEATEVLALGLRTAVAARLTLRSPALR
ncbi:MAG: hypothetical protein EXQ89_00160 [Rhodospirillaceae bacterium]|nr:hypothetical protein [Rhodospirillaceae bacterium]